MTMDELITQGYCFFVGRTIVKPDLVFCTIRDVRGETVAQARAQYAEVAISTAIATMGKPVLAPAKPVMPGLPSPRRETDTVAMKPRTMPGMPQPKGTNQ